jgi:HK97 family phage major capsid protein
VRISREPLTYELHNQEGRISERSFFRDMLAARNGDIGAMERLSRHNREMVVEKRALNETAGTGGDFVAPIYLMNDWIKLARAGRITADACTHMELPPSTNSLNVPKLATGTATAYQADLGNVQSTDPTTSIVTVTVNTVAGNNDLSRQLFDRMLPGFDQVLLGDLAADYNTRLNIGVLSGNGSSPNPRGILEQSEVNTVTFTSASPTVTELYGWLANALQLINTKRYLPATAFILHPRRWAWLLAQVDTTGRPLVVPHASGAYNAVGNLQEVVAEGIVGQLLGVPVLLDPSIPTTKGAGTNQDVIIAARVEDLYLWEEPAPVYFKVFEEVLSKELAIRLQVFGYSAFTAARYPQSISVVSGTGLVTPVFV